MLLPSPLDLLSISDRVPHPQLAGFLFSLFLLFKGPGVINLKIEDRTGFLLP